MRILTIEVFWFNLTRESNPCFSTARQSFNYYKNALAVLIDL